MQPLRPRPLYDPAPSRMKYRLQRMWLTPIYRALIRTGLPIFCLFFVLITYLKDPTVQQNITAYFENARTSIEERPEFMIERMYLQGVTSASDAALRKILAFDLPVSSFKLDLETLKAAIEDVEAVESAVLMVRTDGTLDIGIVERVPVLIWRHETGLMLLDKSGALSGRMTSRLQRADLPLTAGAGVQDNVPEALEIFQKLTSISERVRGLIRVGERRWDVVLNRGQVVQLPEHQPLRALERVLAIHKAQDILSRDITTVDMRNGRKPVLRLSSPAMDGLKALRLITNEEDT